VRPKEQGQRVTVDNTHELFVWYEDYRALVCIEHGYAVQNISSHLRVYYYKSTKEKRAVTDMFIDYNIQAPKDISLPPLLGIPLLALGKL
jgi:hypothetical protein